MKNSRKGIPRLCSHPLLILAGVSSGIRPLPQNPLTPTTPRWTGREAELRARVGWAGACRALACGVDGSGGVRVFVKV